MITGRPRWIDQEKVAEFILKMRHGSLLRAMGLEEGPGGDIYSTDQDFQSMTHEQEAVEAAQIGKVEELADYFEIEARHLKIGHEYILRLKPDTLLLVAEFLRGKRNLKTGRDKSDPKQQQRGRRKMSAKERADGNPVHDAARFDFPAVMEVLREEYPGKTVEQYSDCAFVIVERMSGVKTKTLENHLN